MLETIDLTKVYRPKKGVPVTAIDKVSLRFPEKGMVFLLGKSGSGKSTLLNLLGGLDRYDSGEIVIKGVSSADFKQQHFDSYRNTYVGFIFQEYNILEEFSVGANIALALELQGKKATDEEINRILARVDLDGYGNRKPNELSGGQKQRVAIARALVKNPEIIMADEPTGALDSVTGRQILDTLKELSKEKLVITVSHDREFAEQYADRIIELADGKVISDLTYTAEAEAVEEPKGLVYDGSRIEIPEQYHLTEEDRLAINRYLDALRNGKVELTAVKRGSSRRAVSTDQAAIEAPKESVFRLIKSKLPLRSAFKIGVGGLKYKKVRLVFTILLSCIAFGLFGLADTFGAYDHVTTCTNSIMDSKITYLSLQRSKYIEDEDGGYYSRQNRIGESDLQQIREDTGVEMTGVYRPATFYLSLSGQYDDSVELTETGYDIYATELIGFAEVNEESLKGMNFRMAAGRLPEGTKNEVAITSYVCETFMKAGYSEGPDENGKSVYTKITGPADMVGKKLTLAGTSSEIVGVVDTGFDLDRYRSLAICDEDARTADEIIDFVLYDELSSSNAGSLNLTAMVGEGKVAQIAAEQPDLYEPSTGYISFRRNTEDYDYSWEAFSDQIGELTEKNARFVTWLDGKERTALAEDEIVLNSWELDALCELVDPEEAEAIRNGTETVISWENYVGSGESNEKVYRIVGMIDNEKYPELQNVLLASREIVGKIADPDSGIYRLAVGAMPSRREDIRSVVSYCYRENVPVRYEMINQVVYELDAVHEILRVLSSVFLYIGLGFALFAALMLANFISISISYKKQEIGVLRAIGSRSNDVFRIFFSESFVIAMINFVLSAVGTLIATLVINQSIRSSTKILVTVLSFGPRQILLLFAVSLLVAAVASFIPVKRIASKRPIDAIRNR